MRRLRVMLLDDSGSGVLKVLLRRWKPLLRRMGMMLERGRRGQRFAISKKLHKRGGKKIVWVLLPANPCGILKKDR